MMSLQRRKRSFYLQDRKEVIYGMIWGIPLRQTDEFSLIKNSKIYRTSKKLEEGTTQLLVGSCVVPFRMMRYYTAIIWAIMQLLYGLLYGYLGEICTSIPGLYSIMNRYESLGVSSIVNEIAVIIFVFTNSLNR